MYYGNFQRELVGKMLDSSFRKEMLPKAIKNYCENNIAYTKVGVFNVKPSKPIKQKKAKAIPTFVKTLQLIKDYHKQGTDVKYHKEYMALLQQMLEGGGNNLARGMRLLRLENCIYSQNSTQIEEILKTSIQDMKDADYKDEYSNKVLRPMFWWKMTIAMKIEQEGETKELKHFFDCNASALKFSKTVSPKQKVKTIRTKKVNYDGIIDQKDQIFKYYAATFVNTPTPDLNNEKAIEAGIIPPKWIEANNTIRTIGVPLVIQGMPQGGVKLTYEGIPKGSTCERITTLNIFPEIFFDHKTYDGIDYLLIDGHKLKYRHFNGKYAKRLCDKQEMHTISFVIENTVVEKKYQRKEIDCQHDNYKKIKTIDTQRYAPNGIAVSGNHRYFTLSGSKSALYHATIPAKVSNLPQELENAYYLAMDEFGIHIAVPQGRGFSFWNIPENRMITRLKYDHPLYDLFNVREVHFLPNKNLLAAIAEKGQEVRILDPIDKKMIMKIVPKFFDGEKKSRYRGPRITALAISYEGKQLFIGGNRKKIEIWKISDDFDSKGGQITYHDMIDLPRGPEVGAIQPDPTNPDNIYIAMRNNQLYLYSLTHKKILKTYVADSYMDPKDIQISDDGQYIMVTGSNLFIWKTDSTVQFDIFSGDGVVGGLFKPFTHQVITAGITVDRWELKD
jgi:WD40 repeat protein